MNLIYWVSTSLVSAFMLICAYTYFFHNLTMEGVRNLGFPDFFPIQLAVLKLLAVLVLMLPAIPIQIKEWAYAGVRLFLITAIVAHAVHNDSWVISLINFVLIILLGVSNIYLYRIYSELKIRHL